MNSYFNGLLYVVCVVALVACGSSETTDSTENTGTDNTEETQSTDDADTTDGTDTTDSTDTTDGTDTTDSTDTTDGTDGTDSTDTTDGTDTTDNTDNTDSTDTTDGFTCPEDDDLEDNDTNDTATAATPGSTFNAISCSIDGEYNHDNDVFVVNVEAGCTLVVDAIFTNADGDLDMAMTDATSGDMVGEGGQSEDDNEQMTYSPSETTDVYVSIFPYMSMGNQYVLNVNVACP